MTENVKVDKAKIEAALDEIRPALVADGGNVELIDVNDEGVVLVRLQGSCSGCPSATMTLKMGIERTLMEKVPGVTAVQAIM
ncbi:MAG: NifU family protein [Candidatus Nitrospinota bacterium M3_3B_026]